MHLKFYTVLLLAVLVLASCVPQAAVPSMAASSLSFAGGFNSDSPAPSSTPAPTKTPAESTTANVIGPNSYPEAINPLTGLPVEDPDNLALPPALVSITNFPITARPQAGLSYSPVVFELYIGQGDSRFLAVFYGDYPEEAEALNQDASQVNADPSIGPVRSGRLPYEPLRAQYNGFLVMASAYKDVTAQLSQFTNIFASDGDNINSAMLDVTKLAKIAEANKRRLGSAELSGNAFGVVPPTNGLKGEMVWLPWAYLNQVIWRYDQSTGSYNRYQDAADGVTFVESTDRLNGDPLTYENVVILFAQHHAYAETLIDMDLQYISRMPALIFRDGKMYKAFWTTANGEYERKTGKLRPIRFIDEQGNPFPLKPGQTWVEMVPTGTPYNETVDSENYFELKRGKETGSGVWAIHFSPPPIEERP